MAPVPATIDVSFVSNFTGQHRICWRIAPNLVYDCSTVVVCAGLGNPCSASIPITVDNESCDTVLFEGYVQAACEDIGSLNGRIPFSQSFVPNPTCKPYSITCNWVTLADGVVTNPGSGYDPLNPPVPTPFGGGGGGASFTTTVGNSIATINPGAGYAPDGLYVGVPLINVAGIGVGATADVTILGGQVDSFIITASGFDYYAGDTFTFNDSDLGNSGLGSGFLAGFQAGYGTVLTVDNVVPGTLYTGIPSLIFPAPLGGGTLAAADAVLNDCPTQNLGNGCNGNPPNNVQNLQLNQTFINCMLNIPQIDPSYGIVQDPLACCYDCVQASFTAGPVGVTLHYANCIDQSITTVVMAPAQVVGPVCVVNNTWWWSDGDEAVAVVTAPGCP